MNFEKIAIKEIVKETANCVSIAFDIPAHLSAFFKYTQGQYITLKTQINGQEIRRSYSLFSTPLEQDFRVAIKKVDGGIFSTYANTALQVGDVLEVMAPNGKFFTSLQKNQSKKYIAIAAGSGITPILSIIKTTLLTEPNSNFTLVYGNKNRHSIIFKEQLEALKNKYVNRFNLIHILSKERTDATINFGRINAEKCNQLFNGLVSLTADDYFLCGPEEMIFSVQNFLFEKGIAKEKIHFELFGTSKKKNNEPRVSEITNNPKSSITLKVDGRIIDFKLTYNSISILDAAMQEGADLPYACKGGVCCTCRAKLIEGKVDMEVNYALEEAELAQGFILTCQATPTTEKVVIDFDVK